jgi:glycerophosphoryl diester phosphodiesterase
VELTLERQFVTLDRTIPNPEDFALALRHAPRIRFDAREPFLPLVVGYTVFRENGTSPSFPREIVLPASAARAVEYAVWWDWDIQHLYELEHIWVYLDGNEQIVAADASWHGGYHAMLDGSGTVPLEDGRVTLFSEPGKHAFAPVVDWLIERRPTTVAGCGSHSGKMGVLVTPLFEGIIHDRRPLNSNVVHAHLERQAFVPAYEFSQRFDLASAVFVPWGNLFQWIPARVSWWADYLRETTPSGQRRPLRIAHRGASAYAQEGSRASVEKAAQLGADLIEVDVRVTADDIPVIAHDPDLQRVFGLEGTIGALTIAELKALTPPNHQPILTFEEMAALCDSLGLGLYLDIKEVTPDAMARVIAILRKRGLLQYAIFGSFRPDVVAEIKANAPDAPTSILFASAHVDPTALAAAVGADYVHPCWERFDSPSALLAGEWMERVRAAGLGIICWHEERPGEIAALHALGVDGICSDQPELLLVPGSGGFRQSSAVEQGASNHPEPESKRSML